MRMPVCWNGRRGGLKIRCQRWRVGSSPTTGTTSSRTSYRSRRRFLFQSKRHLSFTPSLLLSAKGHARLACPLVNALTTARCRYRPFAGYKVCRYNDHRLAKSIENSIDFAAKRQVWQRICNEYMAKQPCCFTAQQSCAAKSFFAFRHHIIIIIIRTASEELSFVPFPRFQKEPRILHIH